MSFCPASLPGKELFLTGASSSSQHRAGFPVPCIRVLHEYTDKCIYFVISALPNKTLLLSSSSLQKYETVVHRETGKQFLQIQKSQLPNPSKVKKDITGKVCYQATGVDFITSALLPGHWRPAATSVFRANQPCFVSGWWSKIAVAFLSFDPPGIAQDRSGNHESVCLSVCKSQEAAPAKSPKSSECSKTRCQNNATPSLPPAGPLSGIITCLSRSLGLQQVQAEGPLYPARGEGRQHHPAHAVPCEEDSVSSLCLF